MDLHQKLRDYISFILFKDYGRDIDDHGLFFMSSNWPNLKLYRAFVCMIHNFGQSVATTKLTYVFMVAGWCVTVDFYSQYKI